MQNAPFSSPQPHTLSLLRSDGLTNESAIGCSGCVVLIALFAMQVGVHPRTLPPFFPLGGFVRPRPIIRSLHWTPLRSASPAADLGRSASPREPSALGHGLNAALSLRVPAFNISLAGLLLKWRICYLSFLYG